MKYKNTLLFSLAIAFLTSCQSSSSSGELDLESLLRVEKEGGIRSGMNRLGLSFDLSELEGSTSDTEDPVGEYGTEEISSVSFDLSYGFLLTDHVELGVSYQHGSATIDNIGFDGLIDDSGDVSNNLLGLYSRYYFLTEGALIPWLQGSYDFYGSNESVNREYDSRGNQDGLETGKENDLSGYSLSAGLSQFLTKSVMLEYSFNYESRTSDDFIDTFDGKPVPQDPPSYPEGYEKQTSGWSFLIGLSVIF